MGILMFIILGAVVGLVIGAGMPHAPGGAMLTGLIGLVGGLIGGIAGAGLTGMNPLSQFFGFWAWVGAIAGAILVLAAYALIGAGGAASEMSDSGDRTTGR